MSKPYRMDISAWYVERAAFLVAGIAVVAFAILSIFVHPGFVWGDLFVGTMLVFFAMTGYCPSAMLISLVLRKR